MLDFFEKTFFFGIGLASLTKEKIEKMVGEMVEKGKLSQAEGKKLVKELAARGKQEKDALSKIAQEEIKKRLDSTPLATKEEVKKLEAEVKKLKAKLAKKS